MRYIRALVFLLIIIISITLGFIQSSELTGRYNSLTHFFAKNNLIDEVNVYLDLINQAANLQEKEEYDQALLIIDKLITQTWYTSQKNQRLLDETVSSAYDRKIQIYKKLNRYSEIPTIADSGIKRFSGNKNVSTQDDVARLYLGKIDVLIEQGENTDKVLSLCKEMRDYFEFDDEGNVNLLQKTNLSEPGIETGMRGFSAKRIVDSLYAMSLYEILELQKSGQEKLAKEKTDLLSEHLTHFDFTTKLDIAETIQLQNEIYDKGNIVNHLAEYFGDNDNRTVQLFISNALLKIGDAKIQAQPNRSDLAQESYIKLVKLYLKSPYPEIQNNVELAISKLKKLP